MIRRFNGIDDAIQCAVGASDIQGDELTVLALIRFAADPEMDNYNTVLSMASKDDGEERLSFVPYFADPEFPVPVIYGISSQPPIYIFDEKSPTEWLFGGGWGLFAMVKSPDDDGFLRIYRFDTQEWTRIDGEPEFSWTPGNLALWIGSYGTLLEEAWEANYHGKFDIAALSILPDALSDEQVEALVDADSIEESWDALNPATFWMFDQESVDQPLLDRTGNGADQIEIFGTTALDEEPPIPYRSEPEPSPNGPPVSPGRARAGATVAGGAAAGGSTVGSANVGTSP